MTINVVADDVPPPPLPSPPPPLPPQDDDEYDGGVVDEPTDVPLAIDARDAPGIPEIDLAHVRFATFLGDVRAVGGEVIEADTDYAVSDFVVRLTGQAVETMDLAG